MARRSKSPAQWIRVDECGVGKSDGYATNEPNLHVYLNAQIPGYQEPYRLHGDGSWEGSMSLIESDFLFFSHQLRLSQPVI